MLTTANKTPKDFVKHCTTDLIQLIKSCAKDEQQALNQFHYNAFRAYTTIVDENEPHQAKKEHVDEFLCILWLITESCHPVQRQGSIEKVASEIMERMEDMFGDLSKDQFQHYILNSQMLVAYILFSIGEVEFMKTISNLLFCFWRGRSFCTRHPNPYEGSTPERQLHTQERAAS